MLFQVDALPIRAGDGGGTEAANLGDRTAKAVDDPAVPDGKLATGIMPDKKIAVVGPGRVVDGDGVGERAPTNTGRVIRDQPAVLDEECAFATPANTEVTVVGPG